MTKCYVCLVPLLRLTASNIVVTLKSGLEVKVTENGATWLVYGFLLSYRSNFNYGRISNRFNTIHERDSQPRTARRSRIPHLA